MGGETVSCGPQLVNCGVSAYGSPSTARCTLTYERPRGRGDTGRLAGLLPAQGGRSVTALRKKGARIARQISMAALSPAGSASELVRGGGGRCGGRGLRRDEAGYGRGKRPSAEQGCTYSAGEGGDRKDLRTHPPGECRHSVALAGWQQSTCAISAHHLTDRRKVSSARPLIELALSTKLMLGSFVFEWPRQACQRFRSNARRAPSQCSRG